MTPEPMSPEDLAAIRAHPRFREAVQVFAASNLARYRNLSLIERWVLSDVGRGALSGAAIILETMPGPGVTLPSLTAWALANNVCSRGRVRLYLDRAVANGLLVPEAGGQAGPDTRLAASPMLVDVMTDTMPDALAAAALVTHIAPGSAAAVQDRDLRRQAFLWGGMFTAMRPDLFPIDGRPVHLFQNRDGGMRVLEALIVGQPADRARLIQTCRFSRNAMSQAAFCSRTHVRRLIDDGEAAGLLKVDGAWLTASPALSEDVERYYAIVFALVRMAAGSIADRVS